ncbi:hypothetical protein CAMRE0001_0451 [Campylobacter rectus RM3267]|uniref:Uncharacterized protein n=1 Tax=Campylobacter rectus RM3267 TaxID=553218 RepID=B9D3N2_CAMRE|nr:hypothetical protein CAMRE0001_0451 [Campylobacter rectus RM3267]
MPTLNFKNRKKSPAKFANFKHALNYLNLHRVLHRYTRQICKF